MGKLNVVAEPGTQAIVMTREFDAPRELVFKAFTDPALIPKWWGMRSETTIVDKMEPHKGGVWRYIARGEDHEDQAFNGVYHEVIAPERIVYTFEYEPMAGHVLLETVTFEDRNGKTLVTTNSIYESVADRDGMVSSGMEEGSTESYDRLEELLAEM
jgi:uncharacterized protein YndB with AHSA1/START domain